jgi:DNA-binding IclR family transcriptional regulator
MNYHRHVPASIRTLHILETLAAAPEGLTAGQLAEAVDIPHSALHALLNTLKAAGYVVQTGARQPYRVGPRAQALDQPRPAGISTLVNAFYEETTHHLPIETLALATLADANSVALILAEAPSSQTVRCAVPVGQRTPAAEHPAGLVLLAGLAPAEISRAILHYSAKIEDARRQTMALTVSVRKRRCWRASRPFVGMRAARLRCCTAYAKWPPGSPIALVRLATLLTAHRSRILKGRVFL